ncbi:RNase H family protein [Mycolicibacterium celeriflavum]|uniref:ribonuclease HI n=1 Tax=Mycolicibacterium celeriflavum TaxID=1249101 RepID=UPI003CF1B62A
MHTATAPEPTAAPKPVARPPRVDVVAARPRPITSVAVALTRPQGPVVRYSACSEAQRWTGIVRADSVETALLDVVRLVREESESERLRFLVQVPPRSTLWALRDEIALLIPGVYLERPRLSDEQLVRAAHEGLRVETPAGPVWVATDGSVRGKVTGFGWLASSGEYGLMGFRHSRKQIGPKVVLVAELRAIAKAVEKLRGRDITVLSDSKAAVAMVTRWMAGEEVLPEGYTVFRENGKTPGLVKAQRMIHAERDRITPVWVKGHRGEPLNEGADALARLASRHVLGDSGLDGDGYHRRADGLAHAFAAEFNRRRSA